MFHIDDDSTIPKQVRFASNVESDSKSVKTDKRNNLAHRRKKNKKITGIRSKFILEGTRQELYHLQRENEVLRRIIQERIQPIELAESILLECESPPVDIFLRSSMLTEYETKEGDESNSGHDAVKSTKSPSTSPAHLTRVGLEIETLRPPVPIKELYIPEPPKKNSSEDKRYIMEKMQFVEKDKSEYLVDAFTGEFAY